MASESFADLPSEGTGVEKKSLSTPEKQLTLRARKPFVTAFTSNKTLNNKDIK